MMLPGADSFRIIEEEVAPTYAIPARDDPRGVGVARLRDFLDPPTFRSPTAGNPGWCRVPHAKFGDQLCGFYLVGLVERVGFSPFWRCQRIFAHDFGETEPNTLLFEGVECPLTRPKVRWRNCSR